jgi:hypothetical protein
VTPDLPAGEERRSYRFPLILLVLPGLPGLHIAGNGRDGGAGEELRARLGLPNAGAAQEVLIDADIESLKVCAAISGNSQRRLHMPAGLLHAYYRGFADDSLGLASGPGAPGSTDFGSKGAMFGLLPAASR